MANMGYCRFENTMDGLQDCYDHIDDELSDEEKDYRYYLIELCKKIADEYGENN